MKFEALPTGGLHRGEGVNLHLLCYLDRFSVSLD